MHTFRANCSRFRAKWIGPIKLQYACTHVTMTPARTRTATALTAMMANAEGMWFGNVYDKHKICYPIVCRPPKPKACQCFFLQKKVNLCAISLLATSLCLDFRLSDRDWRFLLKKKQASVFSEVAPQLGRDLRRGSPPSNTPSNSHYSLRLSNSRCTHRMHGFS